MTQPFLITGLPRSRTAWLATLANCVPGVICQHEPTQEWAAWEGCFTAWRGAQHAWAGFADHALGFHLPEIVARSAARVLIVDRDIEDVRTALGRLMPTLDFAPFLALLKARLRAAATLPGVKVVPYAALRHFSAAYDCLEHLLPGAAIDRDKLGAQMRLHVQADVLHAAATAQARAGDLAAILGADVVAELKEAS